MTVQAGSIELTSAVKSRIVDTKDDVNTELFQTILKDSSLTIPYVALGETVQIQCENKAPRSCTLLDYVLNEDGTLKYTKQATQTIDIKFEGSTGSFILQENRSANLSSNSKDYESGATIRGFRLLCSGEDNIQESAFIIKTDAFQKE